MRMDVLQRLNKGWRIRMYNNSREIGLEQTKYNRISSVDIIGRCWSIKCPQINVAFGHWLT